MENALKKLMESSLLTDEVKTAIQQAWEEKVNANREEIREQFAALYQQDKKALVEAMDKFLNEAVNKHAQIVAEEAREMKLEKLRLNRAIQEARNAYKAKIAEHAKVLETFMLGKLKEELEPMRDDHVGIQRERVRLQKQIVETKKLGEAKLHEQSENLKKYVMSKLSEERNKLQAQKEALAEEKVRIAKKLREERQALREQQDVRVKKLENFVLEQMVREFKELNIDRKALIEAKVKLVKESKEKLEEAKTAFIKRASVVLEKTLHNQLVEELTAFKNDIKEARENRFGRKIFEAVAETYMVSYLNEGSQVKKLTDQLNEMKSELENAKKTLTESTKELEVTQRKIRLVEDKASRSKIMTDLLATLGREKRVIMEGLLETVKTENLREAFNKYLPSVISETKLGDSGVRSTRKILSENKDDPRKPSRPAMIKDYTGNRINKLTESATAERGEEQEMLYLRKLAGITK